MDMEDIDMSKRELHLGVVGLGGRGYSLLKDIMCGREGVHILAVCDAYPDRAEAGAAAVKEVNGNTPLVFTDYKKLLELPEVDTVVVTAAWEAHIPVCIDAMLAGKAVASEVGGAYSVEQCWDLVRTAEQTGMPCMMLENCCYGRDELMVLNMVKKGLFGDIVHCEGGYQHDLRSEISFGRENRHYRLRNYINRNCENYPTHELGPIAKVLNINRGNRMVSLTSTASCAKGLNDYLKREKGEDYGISNFPFAQGDVVNTVIKCAHGETIHLVLDTTLPRYYSRNFTVRGTRGMFREENRSVFLDGVHNKYDFDWTPMWNNVEEYREEYDHPIWKKFLNDGVRGGHGGMDTLVFDAFFGALMEGKPMPIDVYDMAAWMCITALSEQSIALGSAPVAIPDFTDGAWLYREEEPDWTYALSKICE